jgi:hypothetical protein
MVHTEVSQENLKRTAHLENIGTLEDNIEININKLCCVNNMDLSGPVLGLAAGTYIYGYEVSDAVNCGKFLDHLNDSQLIM